MIRHRLTLATALAFLLAGTMVVYLVNEGMRREARQEAKAKAEIILDRNMAVHRFFAEELKPSVYPLIPAEQETSYFDPTWMSSTHALTHITEEFDRLSEADYVYKDAAVNARSPRNEADPFERRFLVDLNRDPSLQVWSGVRVIDGSPVFQVLKRGEVMEEACLRCHSEPEAAPTALVAEFGPERSFHRRVGDTVSALSVRVPLEQAYASANRLSVGLSVLIVALLALLFALQTWWNRRMLFVPIDRLRRKASEIADSEAALGDQIAMPRGAELQELTAAFNTMSASLRSARDHLESRVQERTEELSRLVAALEQTAEGVLVTGAEGEVRFANAAMERMSGVPGSELRDGVAWEVIPDLAAAVRTQLEAALGPGPSEPAPHAPSIITATLGGSGSERLLELTASPIIRDETVAGAVLVARDVTEQRHLEEQVADARRSESIGILAAGIAHEFNNQLTAILGNAQLMMAGDDIPFPEELREIATSAGRAADLTDHLLAFGQRQLLKPSRVRLDQLVRGLAVADRLPPNIAYETHLLPAEALVDADRLSQALSSLIDNAVAAMPLGGLLRIDMRPGRLKGDGEDTPAIDIAVADTGVGMDEQTRRHAVEPFFTTHSRAESSGLGLSLVHGVISQSGGQVEITSRPGAGTTVTVTLPWIPDSSGLER